MNMAGAMALGLFVTISTAAAYAQTPSLGDENAGNRAFSGSTVGRAGSVPEPDANHLHKLFTLGGLPVYVYAPVEPPYSGAMNRNLAADPLWQPGF